MAAKNKESAHNVSKHLAASLVVFWSMQFFAPMIDVHSYLFYLTL